MPDAVISFKILEANIPEMRAAFQWELGLPGLATADDFKAWQRNNTKDVLIRYREHLARQAAIAGVDRTDPTAD